MNVLSLMATLGLDTKEYDEGLGNARGNAEAFGKKLTKILGGIAIGAALKKVTDQIVSLTKQAVKAYAEYEQLVGGVETLFGTGGKSLEQFAENASKSMYHMGQKGEDIKKLQQELIKAGYDVGEAGADGIYGPQTQAAFDAYAKAGGQMVQDAYNNMEAASKAMINNSWNAAQSVGMDSNTYIRNVTGFSSSLIKSLGGDTQKAADIADMAMRDIADNANTYGKFTVDELGGVYQALARGNYQTLDNLNLGFAGTKTGMEMLIAEANDYRKAQGLSADLTIDKYADIVQAIHEIQVARGIYQKTENEAETTIQGSLSATRAEWNNLMIAMASGDKGRFSVSMKNMVKSAKNLVKNVTPIIKQALSGIGDLVSELGPVIIDELPGLIADVGPDFLTGVGKLFTSLVKSVPALLGGLGSAIKQTITGDANASWPEVATAIFNGIKEKFTSGLDTIKEAMNIDPNASWKEVANAIGQGIKDAFATGMDTIKALLGISGDASWEEVGTAIVNGITKVFDTGMAFIKGLLGLDAEASWGEVGEAIRKGVVETFTNGVEWLKQILGIDGRPWSEVGTSLAEGLESAFNSGIEFIKGLLGLDDPGALNGIGNTIAELISGGFEAVKGFFLRIINDATEELKNIDWQDVGRRLFDSLLKGFSPKDDSLIGKMLKGAFLSPLYIVDWSEALEIGRTIARFIGQGISSAEDLVGGAIDGLIQSITGTNKFDGLGKTILQAFIDPASLIIENWEKVEAFFDRLVDSIKSGIDWLTGTAAWKLFFGDGGEGNVPDPFAKEIPNYGGVGKNSDGTYDFSGLTPFTSENVETEVQTGIENGASEGAVSMQTDLETSAQNAAPVIQSTIQAALDGIVVPDFGGGRSGGGGIRDASKGAGSGRRHATAMSDGEILRGLTPFGIDSNGTIHYGGEAGAEAVVGVNSLDSMIQNSVNNAVAKIAAMFGGGGNGRVTVQLVLDSGALLGEVDLGLNEIAQWRGGGRA